MSKLVNINKTADYDLKNNYSTFTNGSLFDRTSKLRKVFCCFDNCCDDTKSEMDIETAILRYKQESESSITTYTCSNRKSTRLKRPGCSAKSSDSDSGLDEIDVPDSYKIDSKEFETIELNPKQLLPTITLTTSNTAGDVCFFYYVFNENLSEQFFLSYKLNFTVVSF